jgi:hypothetical protein
VVFYLECGFHLHLTFVLDLVPFQQYVDTYRYSHFATVYFYACCVRMEPHLSKACGLLCRNLFPIVEVPDASQAATDHVYSTFQQPLVSLLSGYPTSLTIASPLHVLFSLPSLLQFEIPLINHPTRSVGMRRVPVEVGFACHIFIALKFLRYIFGFIFGWLGPFPQLPSILVECPHPCRVPGPIPLYQVRSNFSLSFGYFHRESRWVPVILCLC